MAYIVVNKNGTKAFGGEKFSSKSTAEQAIVDAIKGSFMNKNSLKYYRTYFVRKIK